MEPIRTAHERPVDLISSKLLWKAPWWAHYSEPAKKAVLEVTQEYPSEIWIDYTKSPPHRRDPILNRIGTRLQWADGSIGTIIGYADSVERYKETTQFNPKPHWWIGNNWNPYKKRLKKMVTHFWWVQRHGEIFRLGWHHANSSSWKAI